MRHIYANFIDKVAKPARYLGGEYLAVEKPAAGVDVRIALAFPDVYEIGMSHLGTKILYSLLNGDPRIAAERVFTPWTDMEAELRARELPLVSLETQTRLADFDVVGFSLQYELTFTNVLTMLDLGGIPVRAADRTDAHPIVVGGGPTATHPEPVAPFFDAFWIGEAEEELPAMLRELAALKREGRGRLDVLAELASRYPLYVPALYDTEVDPDTGMVVVGAPRDPRVPARVRRGLVEDIDAYPFPKENPVPYAEAVFDRAAVEIARGCTEGCRFCQAGMIYRPVRERSPESIVDSVIGGAEAAGYDETALTSLSTADYSCITPLVREVATELKKRKVAMSVSSLRAYGLDEEILDAMASMRITGLTFAPEAGTQRMRDVVNKNITEAHVAESAERVFKRGWNRLKLYFMIGLPTEEDSDVVGIVETGERMLRIGRGFVGKKASVTVSCSSHVPKPHTPFQWCAQDSIDEIGRKQRLLRGAVSEKGLKLKYHDRGISFVEGVLSRGDRRLAAVIEDAWRRGARFDGWDELFEVDRWREVFAAGGVDVDAYLGTRPVTARLPWDHIDVGLEDGFLLGEYRKALKNRLSPPCGKVVGQLVHHTNLNDARADERKLVCYDCGVACDLSAMRGERLRFLDTLGAEAPAAPAAPVLVADAPLPGGGRRKPTSAFPHREAVKIRLRYTKLGRVAFLGHLDTARVLMRLFRRAELPVAYSRGFKPKPLFAFGPALALGVPSLGELADVSVEGTWTAGEVARRLREVAPRGIDITGAWPVAPGEDKLSRRITAYDLAIRPADDGAAWTEARCRDSVDRLLTAERAIVDRKGRPIDVRGLVEAADVLAGADAARVCGVFEWPEAAALIRVRVAAGSGGSAKPIEVARALGAAGDAGDPGAPPPLLGRLGFPGAVDDAAAEPPAAPTPFVALGPRMMRGMSATRH